MLSTYECSTPYGITARCILTEGLDVTGISCVCATRYGITARCMARP